jgi:hypothetical protein
MRNMKKNINQLCWIPSGEFNKLLKIKRMRRKKAKTCFDMSKIDWDLMLIEEERKSKLN